ncbi:4Fe-4S binding protein [Sedimentibacter sp. MB35-C1]|uniref:4Fe-4S binding protein n=1 Tax=Sedimentibacter sp. MB35-C1 TaxID=3070995 RepID=UPI0027E0EEB6|nr:4Fe-4S binding protein [Sedimentibacter sp. MB35-C1]WMJ77348.1 4Fe-4S binding protein [Sedimentibacter sp. MB35-C1]
MKGSPTQVRKTFVPVYEVNSVEINGSPGGEGRKTGRDTAFHRSLRTVKIMASISIIKEKCVGCKRCIGTCPFWSYRIKG